MESFKPSVDYQIYCSTECREMATKAKVKERARIKSIRKRALKKRYCSNGCGTKLSVYNDAKVCMKCSVDQKLVDKAIQNIKDFFEFEEEK